ncbi:hypothetical protein ABIF26_005505 [Bradyrhizobium elkanii]
MTPKNALTGATGLATWKPRLFQLWRTGRPKPATVADIVSGYGWHAARERWPDLSHKQLRSIYAASTRQPAESVPGLSGQPARALGGIDPPEFDITSESWLSPGECSRECGLARRRLAVKGGWTSPRDPATAPSRSNCHHWTAAS